MPYGYPPGTPQAYGEDEFDQQDEFGDDQYLAELEALQQDEFQPGQFNGGFMERFAPLSNLDLPRPQSFGEGLLQGIAGGLGRQGTQSQKARQRFDESEAERRKSFDVERRAASRELRLGRGRSLRDKEKEKSDDRKTRKKYEDETHLLTEADIKEFPHLARVADSEGRVPKAWVKEAATPAKPEKSLSDIKAEAQARAEGTVSGGGSSLTPEQAAAWAAFAQTTGALPPMGRGGVGSPAGQAISNAMLGGAEGRTPQQVGQALGAAKGTFGATTSALRNIETSLSQQKVFTDKLRLNTDRLRAASKKVADLGPRFLNAPIRNAMNQLGSADQAAFRAALLPVMTESARLLTSGPTLGGQLSDASRKELESIVSGDFNGRQLNAVLDVLENDAQNGIDMYTQQRNQLRSDLGGVAQPSAGFQVAAPNGKTYTFRTQAAADKFKRDARIK